MAVTYSDLVAFGFAYVENSTLLNVRQQKLFNACSCVPALSPSGPCLCAQEDFIIFGEFSEVKGPMPLLTLPFHIQENHMDLVNAFIMRIMSVDYHASPGSQFRVCEDTQVLQTFVTQDKHAYVHYLTLYDVQARGFVRPLCIAYVSSDDRKLHNIFPELKDHFNKITQVMKANSWQLFMRELTSIIRSLKDIQTQLNEITEKEDRGELMTESQKKEFERLQGYQVVQQISEYSDMLVAVEKELEINCCVLEKLEEWKKALMSKNENPPVDQVVLYMKTCAVDGQNIGTLRPLPAISPWGTACALWLMKNVLRRYHQCLLNTHLGEFPSLADSQSPLEKRQFSEPEETAEEALRQKDYLFLLSMLSKASQDLSSFEDSLKVHRQYFLPQFEIGNEVTRKSHPALETKEDSQPEEKERFPCSSSDGSIRKSADTDFESEFMARVFCDPKDSKAVTVSTRDGFSRQQNTSADGDGSSDKDDESFQDIMDSFHSEDSWSVSSVEKSPSDQGSGSGSEPVANEEETEDVSGRMWSQCLWTRHRPRNKSGHRLLKFFWTYRSSAQHLIYSLLVGRTVILAGDSQSEKKTTRVITAITPLIPRVDRENIRVLRWHRGIVVAPHISKYQVIGLCVPERLSIHDMISAKDKSSVTILDVKSGQLCGPAYQGKLLAPLGPSAVDYPSDHSLLLFIQSVFANISTKLFTYNSLKASHSKVASHICRMLDLFGCDADIILYLVDWIGSYDFVARRYRLVTYAADQDILIETHAST